MKSSHLNWTQLSITSFDVKMLCFSLIYPLNLELTVAYCIAHLSICARWCKNSQSLRYHFLVYIFHAFLFGAIDSVWSHGEFTLSIAVTALLSATINVIEPNIPVTFQIGQSQSCTKFYLDRPKNDRNIGSEGSPCL